MNVSDFQSGGLDEAEALIVAKALENEGVHLIEFSGGTYESSAMDRRRKSHATRAEHARRIS